MTAIEASPSIRDAVAYKIAGLLLRRTQRKTRTRTTVQATVRIVLCVAGLAALTMAGFSWNIHAGLIVGGVACFVLAWLTNETSTETDTTPDPALRNRR